MKIRTGDIVTVIAGKDKGKQGRVVRVLADKNRVVVENVNMRVRHIKKTAQQAGQRINFEASLHASNVMILDPKTKKPTRIGFTIDEKTSKKSRIARSSGEIIKAEAKTKAMKPKKAAAAEETKEVTAGAPAAPKKQPFWKRKDSKGGDGGSVSEERTGGAAALPSAHRSQGG